ncbi:MAG: glycerol-3-phosphate dehydrogenase/oxidase [Planctomycetota bacterium]
MSAERPDALGAAARARALAALADDTFDLLVVGAGATGCGTALDAAARGLKVALVDAGDIAGGTSSRSSKLVHGGLRYLQTGDVVLVREALAERELLLTRLAPRLVRPLPFLVPLRHGWDRLYMGAGLTAYDGLARSGLLPGHARLSAAEALEQFPDLRDDTLVGALRYYDAQMDDAHLAVALARTAAGLGVAVATYTAVVSAEAERDADGLRRVTVRDAVGGGEISVAARAVALCVGAWAPEVSGLFCDVGSASADGEAVGVVRSKGVHLRLPRAAISGTSAIIAPAGASVLFVLPNPTHWLIGTTDTEYAGRPEDVAPEPEDVAYLLERLAEVVTSDVSADDVTYAFAGVRPLARDTGVGGSTAKVSREHRISEVADGVLAIVGGKWTTYRIMARDLVDTVVEGLELPAAPCTTDTIALVDARDAEIDGLLAEDPALGEPLVDAPGFRRVDVVQAVRHDGAVTLDDVVERRLRLRLELDTVTEAALADVTRLL